MSTLSKLSFVELPVSATRDVMGYKRKRLIDRIEEQRALLRDPASRRLRSGGAARRALPTVRRSIRLFA